LTSYQANANALQTATVSSFSNAFSFHTSQKLLQLNVPFFVITVALNIATFHSNLNSVFIHIQSVWSL
jgi:hypothetical protein